MYSEDIRSVLLYSVVLLANVESCVPRNHALPTRRLCQLRSWNTQIIIMRLKRNRSARTQPSRSWPGYRPPSIKISYTGILIRSWRGESAAEVLTDFPCGAEVVGTARDVRLPGCPSGPIARYVYKALHVSTRFFPRSAGPLRRIIPIEGRASDRLSSLIARECGRR
jgi:hypothetical protein